jgi:hypothetical protein
MPLIAGLGLVILLQLTDWQTVLARSSPLLAQAGLKPSNALFVALFKIRITFVAMTTVENKGRKGLSLFGYVLVLVALLVLTVTYACSHGNGNDAFIFSSHVFLPWLIPHWVRVPADFD